jgi:phosphopantetheinyl transferase (holo-ACP synthase)
VNAPSPDNNGLVDNNGVVLKVPLLGEHQQLIRDVERLKQQMISNVELFADKIAALDRLTDTRFEGADKAVQAALQAAKEAVDKANTASERRFDSVNEFRAQLGDMVNTLISRVEADARFKAIDDQLVLLRSAVDKGFSGVEGRDSGATSNRIDERHARNEGRDNLALWIAVASVILTVVLTIMNAWVVHVGH